MGIGFSLNKDRLVVPVELVVHGTDVSVNVFPISYISSCYAAQKSAYTISILQYIVDAREKSFMKEHTIKAQRTEGRTET